MLFYKYNCTNFMLVILLYLISNIIFEVSYNPFFFSAVSTNLKNNISIEFCYLSEGGCYVFRSMKLSFCQFYSRNYPKFNGQIYKTW